MKFSSLFGQNDGAWLRQGVVGGAAFGVLVLLAMFYSVVAGAVERGASRRADSGSSATVSVASPAKPGAAAIKVARFDE